MIDFTILIPAYNRPEEIQLGIRSVLRQTLTTFELLIIDDSTNDGVQKAVKKFKDKRIRYYKNEKNMGYALNLAKGFNLAKGEYVFTLGDDDLILFPNTLEEVKKAMDKTGVGIGKIGGFSYDQDPRVLVKAFIHFNELKVYKPTKKPDAIIPHMQEFNFGFYSGLIFKKKWVDNKKFINHLGFVYFPVLYDIIPKHGMVYIPDHYIVAKLSFTMIPGYFDIKKHGSFFMEDFVNLAKENMHEDTYFKNYRKQYLTGNVFFLPNIAYFSNPMNMIEVAKRMAVMEPSLKTNPKFYIFFFASFMPKPMMNIMRILLLSQSKKAAESIMPPSKYIHLIQPLL